MNFLAKLKKAYGVVEDLLTKNHECISCGREIPDGSKYSLCEACFSHLEPIGNDVCKKCGARLNGEVFICDECKDRNFVFFANRSCYSYSGSASAIIKNFKYGGHAYFAPIIAQMMIDNLGFEGVDFLTFVPMSKKKQRARGFNQAELIANEISKLTKIKVLDLLSKVDVTKNQAGLSRVDRLKNLKGSFSLNKDISMAAKGKVILIVDDVFTTGTTLNECAKALLAAKPKQILTMTFAKTEEFSK